MKKVLVTGFEPFLGSPVNPSRKIVERLSQVSGHGERFETLILPVSFAQSVSRLNALLDARDDLGAVLMFGQASGRKKISLERVGLNWRESTTPDEDGFRPALGPIDPSFAPALFSTLPLDRWKDDLAALGLPAEVSLSAGGYVCNSLYFDQLRRATHPALFVHVPYLPEQAKDGEPSLELAEMSRAAEFLLGRFVEMVGVRSSSD